LGFPKLEPLLSPTKAAGIRGLSIYVAPQQLIYSSLICKVWRFLLFATVFTIHNYIVSGNNPPCVLLVRTSWIWMATISRLGHLCGVPTGSCLFLQLVTQRPRAVRCCSLFFSPAPRRSFPRASAAPPSSCVGGEARARRRFF
jgi:hypothetical protein